MRAKQHKHLADVLHQGASRTCTNGLRLLKSNFAIVSGDAHLDQPVGVEVHVDFLEYLFGQAFVAYQYKRVQMVRLRLERFFSVGVRLRALSVMLFLLWVE